MTNEKFQKEISRLTQAFGATGAQVYQPVRLQLLWRELNTITDQQFEIMIDELIGSCRFPPLMPEFRKALAEMRERNWSEQKQKYSEESIEAFRKISAEEAAHVFPALRGMIRGTIPADVALKAADDIFDARESEKKQQGFSGS